MQIQTMIYTLVCYPYRGGWLGYVHVRYMFMQRSISQIICLLMDWNWRLKSSRMKPFLHKCRLYVCLFIMLLWHCIIKDCNDLGRTINHLLNDTEAFCIDSYTSHLYIHFFRLMGVLWFRPRVRNKTLEIVVEFLSDVGSYFNIVPRHAYFTY